MHQIILAGGSSNLRWVEQLILEAFGKPPFNKLVSETIISYGAAMRAAEINGDNIGGKKRLIIEKFKSNLGILLEDSNAEDDKQISSKKNVYWILTYGED